jgi:hypothetical protein
MENGNHTVLTPLFREDYAPAVPPYAIEAPEIPSGSTYYFTSGSGLRYEVLFAKKRNNYLENIVNFSVLNDEFEDEYSETNRGEIYRVIATVAEIIRIYHIHHSYSISYEFSGEFKDKNMGKDVSIRTLVYFRMAEKIIHPSWNLMLEGNRVVAFKSRLNHGQ